MSDLNPAQKAAVKHIDGPLLVLAGAGSGKTRVITEKIAWLIKTSGLAPRHVAAVTFTNKAAREMKERVGKLLQGSNSRGLRISTFHSLGLDIVRREHHLLGLRDGFSILDEEDSMAMIRDIAGKECADKEELVRLRSLIGRYKNRAALGHRITASGDEEAQASHALLDAIQPLAEKYDRRLRACNAVDFDDLLLLPVSLFSRDEERLNAWRDRIRYLLVDEYQDTNDVQYRLVQQLVGIRNSLTVVGDDDQSIYAWRGARPDNLNQLQRDFPGLEVIKLEQNYRSMSRILRTANQLISNNEHLFEKALWCQLGEGESIRVINTPNEEQEASQVALDLLADKLRRGRKFSDYAILYRSNHQSRPLEKALREQQVPCQITGNTSFFARVEVKDIVAYLRLLANVDDDNAFLRIINTPRRGIGTSTLEKLGAYAARRETSLFAACYEMGLSQSLDDKRLERLRRFTDWINTIADQAARGDLAETLKVMLEQIDYTAWLEETSQSPAAAERRAGNVTELLEWVERLRSDDESRDLAAIVNRLMLSDLLERNEDENTPDAVRLMTLHSAKGLEFPSVYLVGMEEGQLPHRNSVESGDVEEERRLAYVGITRARERLTMTLAASRRRQGEQVRTEPSRFLDELPKDDIRWIGGDETKLEPEEKKSRQREHMANIRAILSQN
ncbi:MAG: UvrD-helicase domain-containing protein [Gammaproteobacteria bacterium]|nr:UvrD-helicase domain-containing protein [Gammaproteobacteria bacterium]